MIKKLFLTTQLLFCCFVLHSYARNEYASDSDRDLKRRNKMVKEAALLPDSAFEYVKMEDLLDDQVYMKLAHDGWSPQEIVTIMKTALKDRKAAKNKFGYGWYAKQWLPTYGIMPGGDTALPVRGYNLQRGDASQYSPYCSNRCTEPYLAQNRVHSRRP